MGDYGAEDHPDIPRAQVLIRNYSFIKTDKTLSDEWNIDSANRVSSFHDGTKKDQVHFKYDPHDIDLT